MEADGKGNSHRPIGTSPQGQGHETAYTDRGGTLASSRPTPHGRGNRTPALVPRRGGTMGSRSLRWAAGASVPRWPLQDKARRLAAHLLEVSVDDVVSFDGGRIGVAGDRSPSLAWGGARGRRRRHLIPGRHRAGSRGRRTTSRWRTRRIRRRPRLGRGGRPGHGRSAAAPPRGRRRLRAPRKPDAGRKDRCTEVMAQGAAQALYELVVFDEGGQPHDVQPRTYSIPSAADLPRSSVTAPMTPHRPEPPGGQRGRRSDHQAGPAVHNAVIDALAYLGVRHIDMPPRRSGCGVPWASADAAERRASRSRERKGHGAPGPQRSHRGES